MAKAGPREKETPIHGDELVISGAPYPISTPSIPGQGKALASGSHHQHQQVQDQFQGHNLGLGLGLGMRGPPPPHQISPAVTSSSCCSPSSPHRDVERHEGGETDKAGHDPTPIHHPENRPSIINKHDDDCNASSLLGQQSQQQHLDISEPEADAALKAKAIPQVRQEQQDVQVSCQACHCHSEQLCLCLSQRTQAQEDIIPPQHAQARLTPHQQQLELHHHQQLPAPAPPSYIKSAPIHQSPEPSEDRGGNHTEVHNQTRDTSGIEPQTSTAPNMIFSDLYKSPRSPFHKIRHSIPSVTLPATDLEADLISRDKTRQKEAVKKFLNEKIRNDWEFTWPPTPTTSKPLAPTEEQLVSSSTTLQNDTNTTKLEDGSQDPVSPSTAVTDTPPTPIEHPARDPGEEADSESDAVSVYSTVSEDQSHFHPRVEWTSDISDDDAPIMSSSPFRFDTPDAVGTAVQSSIIERKARRRRAVRDEVAWNTGLACFEARRDAWTGAKTVRVKPKPATPVSPSSTRRLSFWRHHRTESTASQNAPFIPGSPPAISSPLSPTSTHLSEPDSSNGSKGTIGAAMHSTSSQDSSHANYPVETLIPVPPPLLPPQNPMRASVTPSIYPSLYDKIVVHSLQPSCPVNLGDMLRACVVGWKRDGEWPPKSTVQVVPMPTTAEMAAMRQQRKAAQQQQHARKASTATNGSSRRLSFVGFLGGGGGGNKGAATVEKDKVIATTPTATGQNHEEKDGVVAGVNGGGKDTHSDEGNSGGGGAGKGIRRSLQKVFSLGQHHAHGHAHPAAAAESPISPTTATKEVTAAG